MVSGAQDPRRDVPRSDGGGSETPAGAPAAVDEPMPAIVSATVAHKRAQTELLEARAGRELGRLVDRGQFEVAAVSAAAVLQRGLMALPARLGNAIAATLGVDARPVFPLLEDECRALANELAASLEALADQVEAA